MEIPYKMEQRDNRAGTGKIAKITGNFRTGGILSADSVQKPAIIYIWLVGTEGTRSTAPTDAPSHRSRG
jgi:hypothetical protein